MKKFFAVSLGILAVLAGLIFAWTKYADHNKEF